MQISVTTTPAENLKTYEAESFKLKRAKREIADAQRALDKALAASDAADNKLSDLAGSPMEVSFHSPDAALKAAYKVLRKRGWKATCGEPKNWPEGDNIKALWSASNRWGEWLVSHSQRDGLYVYHDGSPEEINYAVAVMQNHGLDASWEGDKGSAIYIQGPNTGSVAALFTTPAPRT